MVSVWIDLDGNGTFELEEKVLVENSVTQEITRDILIPDTALPGTTRMRVYFASENTPCAENEFAFGEAEDYCINLVDMFTSTFNFENSARTIQAIPNPFQNTLVLNDNANSQAQYNISIVNMIGEKVQNLPNYKLGEELNWDDSYGPGVYFLIAENEEERFEIRVIKR